MMFSNYINGMDYQTFFNIIDNMYDEVLIYDKNYNIAYINRACCRHYGCTPSQMIGKSFFDFVNADWWNPSILPITFQEKRVYAIKQKTYMGSELLTISVPILNKENEVEFVVMNVRDEVNDADLYNPHYIPSLDISDAGVKPIFESECMKDVLRLIKKAAKMNVPCVISGEAGVGKKIIAKYMHSLGNKKDKPLVIINCIHMNEDQLKQELGSVLRRDVNVEESLFAKAIGGTVLLTNIAQLSTASQAVLQQILQEYKQLEMNTNIISSTNTNLKELIRTGQFREDLYYSLNVLEIYVPPLRKRREDIRPLVYGFLNTFCNQYNVNRQLSEGAIEVLEQAEWSYNISELKHVVERLVVLSDSLLIDVDQLPKSLFGIVDSLDSPMENSGQSFEEKMQKYEYLLVKEAYDQFGSSRKIASYLGVSQTKANNLVRKHITHKSC